MQKIRELSAANQRRARQVVEDSGVVSVWEGIGAEVRLVGSLKTGLLVKHRDIDFHIYSKPLSVGDSFAAMARLAQNPAIKRIEYANGIDTDERCLEWHAWYEDDEQQLWQLDMIHIESGSRYDGYFERMAERLMEILDEESRDTILRLKYETPDSEKINGAYYYQAVIEGGVRSYEELQRWLHSRPVTPGEYWTP